MLFVLSLALATLYLSPTGSDSNNCDTPVSACRSPDAIRKLIFPFRFPLSICAVARLSCGTNEISVSGGSYNITGPTSLPVCALSASFVASAAATFRVSGTMLGYTAAIAHTFAFQGITFTSTSSPLLAVANVSFSFVNCAFRDYNYSAGTALSIIDAPAVTFVNTTFDKFQSDGEFLFLPSTHSNSNVTISDCTFSLFQNNVGNMIYVRAGSLQVIRTSFSQIRANYSALLCMDAAVRIDHSNFDDCTITAANFAGVVMIQNTANATVSNTNFTNCYAAGSSLSLGNCSLFVSNCHFSNVSTYNGSSAIIAEFYSQREFSISDSTFDRCTADAGSCIRVANFVRGAIRNIRVSNSNSPVNVACTGTNLTISDSQFLSNGGSDGTLQAAITNMFMDNCVFDGNRSPAAGAMKVFGFTQMRNVRFNNNTSTDNGPAFLGETAVLINVTATYNVVCLRFDFDFLAMFVNFLQCSGSVCVAAFYFRNTSMIYNSTVINNKGTGCGGIGSAIGNFSVFVYDSYLESNSGGFYGGGICSTNLIVARTRFVNNTAFLGGALASSNLQASDLYFERNSASFGGAVALNGGVMNRAWFKLTVCRGPSTARNSFPILQSQVQVLSIWAQQQASHFCIWLRSDDPCSQ